MEYNTTQCIGGSYEGYAFELLYETKIWNIVISDLWYYDEETDDAVDILNQKEYTEIEEIAEEEIRYRFE